MKKTVLITGAGGLIGSLLCNELAARYTIRGLDRAPVANVETVVSDLSDLAALRSACEGVDCIVHMAANASVFASWDEVLRNNIVGTYNVYEAAAQAGVKQVIFASTNHVVGTADLERAPAIYVTGEPVLDHLMPVRPDSLYGVSKSFGESLGRYFADHRGLQVICLRIGFINRRDMPEGGRYESLERLSALWISHRDMVQLVEKSLQASDLKFDIFYGISNNQPHFYDLEHAREVIGYVPQDSAHDRLAHQA